MKAMSMPALNVLYALQEITNFLAENGKRHTRTYIRNSLELEDDVVSAAIEFGCGGNYLKNGKYNYITFVEKFNIPENSFYPVVEVCIRDIWIKQNYNGNDFYIENTSHRDSKIVGHWTRPDFTLVSHKKFPWTIGYEFDVVTFEVKRPDSCNVLAVFEALSHSSNATRAYVVFPISEDEWRKQNREQERRVRDECSKHGVGLILIEDAKDTPKAHHVLRAARREIDHEKCSDFLGAVLSDSGRQKISMWK